MKDLIIRPMTEADITALCLADGGETPENRECFARYLTWQEQSKDCVFLLAFLDGQLAGHLFVFYHDCPGGREGATCPGWPICEYLNLFGDEVWAALC